MITTDFPKTKNFIIFSLFVTAPEKKNIGFHKIVKGDQIDFLGKCLKLRKILVKSFYWTSKEEVEEPLTDMEREDVRLVKRWQPHAGSSALLRSNNLLNSQLTRRQGFTVRLLQAGRGGTGG